MNNGILHTQAHTPEREVVHIVHILQCLFPYDMYKWASAHVCNAIRGGWRFEMMMSPSAWLGHCGCHGHSTCSAVRLNVRPMM